MLIFELHATTTTTTTHHQPQWHSGAEGIMLTQTHLSLNLSFHPSVPTNCWYSFFDSYPFPRSFSFQALLHIPDTQGNASLLQVGSRNDKTSKFIPWTSICSHGNTSYSHTVKPQSWVTTPIRTWSVHKSAEEHKLSVANQTEFWKFADPFSAIC